MVADSLLHDILPVHVADVLKLEKKYSQSHKDVGVIFISITNFDQFYDESFEGGNVVIIYHSLCQQLVAFIAVYGSRLFAIDCE